MDDLDPFDGLNFSSWAITFNWHFQENVGWERLSKNKLLEWCLFLPLRTNQQIRADIKQRISTGKFNLGTPDNEYTKIVLTSEGNIEKKVCRVSARKYLLKEVCAQSAKSHNDPFETAKWWGIWQDDTWPAKGKISNHSRGQQCHDRRATPPPPKEVWKNPWHDYGMHDHSSIVSSGFMLFLVRKVYDPAVYLTSKDYRERHGGKGVDVQSTIEAPHLYKLGASGAKDSDCS